ncbi:iron complex outermembrane receptor protein [Rhizomicrobium palustre]|uniref:Iron complex outermembrane receptor protein n=1 Tax=Rhizomicrobium palustre TaxID=189966 RepID=A0A846N372_9PROT|nr:TonB-dependent receptor [Rhizomicrobium palustre]NIK90418.1 iron complex outermembrane receptor protein [Rhizomicrobium palustre]
MTNVPTRRLALLGASLFAMTAAAQAADLAFDQTEEVIVTGTRDRGQTQFTSLSPIDVLNTDFVRSTASPSIDQTLATLVPSFNVKRLPSSDGTQFIRPASLNNLSPDMTLVLVNGKRFHRSAFLGANGAQASDLAMISNYATGHIEVLRDGASAQYGSDAIAGVVNILLNKDTDVATYGQLSQYYYGDGLTLQVGARGGVELPNGGHAVLTVEYQKANETSRTHQRDDAVAFQAAHPSLSVPNPVQRWGNPDMQGIKAAFDASENLTDYVEAYAFATLAASRQHNDINWRNPDTQTSVYKTTAAFPGFDLKTIWPTGFTPDEGVNALDSQMAAGLRHTSSDDFTWDTSVSYGINNSRFFLNNSINASLGPNSPHNFNLGHMIESELNLNADAVYRWALPFFAEPLNVAFGAEYRDETFQMKAGDKASYQVGPGANYGLAAASNGFPGIADTQAGSWGQTSYAGYIDLQAQVTKALQLEVALRDEEYSDFGNTFNYKFGARYEVMPGLAFRGSYSTGFKAPSPGQNNATSTSQGLDTKTLLLYTNGRLGTTNPVAMAFGAHQLKPETSKTATLGMVFDAGNGFTGSIDAFKTDLRSRFSTSSTITIDAATRANLVAQNVPGATSFTSINFFTNDFNTMTRGVEVTGNYGTDLGAGHLRLSGAYSYTATKVTGGTTAAATNTSQKKVFEQGVPQHNASATATYAIGDFEFMSRLRFYGPWTDSTGNTSGLIFQRFGSMEFVDLAVTYNLTDKASIRLGAENVGNFYPEKAIFQASRGIDYSRNAPYDVNGGNYYLRYDLKF